MKGAVVLLGLLGGGAALLFLHSSAHAAEGVPAGWTPPAGATLTTFPATGGPGTIAIKAAGWQAEAGQPPGRFLLLWDPANPKSFVALFFAAATPTVPALMASGTDTNTQLIMSTVPSLLASLNQSGAA